MSSYFRQLTPFYIPGYPQRMKLQRRLYIIYTVYFLILRIPWNFKLVVFVAVSRNRQLEDNIRGNRLNFICFRSSLKSHSLWVTLYILIIHLSCNCIRPWVFALLKCELPYTAFKTTNDIMKFQFIKNIRIVKKKGRPHF